MKETFYMSGDNLDILIPVPLSLSLDTEASIKSVIDLHMKGGFDTFLLTAPSKGWRTRGYPPQDHFKEIAAGIVRFKEAVKEYDISIGWWNTLTLKTGGGDFQSIVDIDGTVFSTSTCPLDKGYQDRFSGDVALVAESSEPALIIFEDDYGLNCHGGAGCFCDLHLNSFAERVGKSYSREELKKLFSENSSAVAALRKEWGMISRDSLAELASRVRQAVDRVTPWIPMGSMQPGCADKDGDSTEAVARAFAGDAHRPFVRLHGTSYTGDDAFALPHKVFHALYGKQHLPDDFICYHESDTYPHNRFYMSAGMMRSLMGAVYSYGFSGSTFQACQALDNQNEEVGYHEMFMTERKRFQTVMKLARQCELQGCGVLSGPMLPNEWISALAHFGIPCSTRESDVNVLAGKVSDSLSDEQIEVLLAKGLLLDGEAAERLDARGFGEAIGVNVNGKRTINDPGRDLSSRERIRDGFLRSPSDGRLMTSALTYSPKGNGKMYSLIPNSSSTEIVTDLIDFQSETIGIGMTRCSNEQGGRVVVMGMSVQNNQSSSLFNYRRARLIQDMIMWAGADDLVYVQEQPKTFCIQNRPRDNDSVCGFLTLINLCADPFDAVKLSVPQGWQESTRIKYLDLDGVWKATEYRFDGQIVHVQQSLNYFQPLYLCFEQ